VADLSIQRVHYISPKGPADVYRRAMVDDASRYFAFYRFVLLQNDTLLVSPAGTILRRGAAG
jgi:hypothetical protein